MKVVIVGIGLIGGSMALDIQSLYPNGTIYALDTNDGNLQQALELSIVHKKAILGDCADADLVIVSIPVDAALSLLPEILNIVSQKTLVLDVGSTKSLICQSLANHPNRKNFLATHPIAGTEFSGPKAAVHNLFLNKTNILCEIEKTAYKLQERALDLFNKLGMRIRYMDPTSHDTHMAYVSHLSHISSFMLGKTVIEKEKNEKDIFDMAGSGFESTVRLAKSSPAMWTPIFKQNRVFVLESLTEYIANLQQFKTLLENENYDALYNEMHNTNKIKNILNAQI